MSSMLEQAVVDAKALKETAIKSAEAAVLEKYADELKEAVGSLLLEQEPGELDLGLDMPEPGLDPDAAADAEDITSQLPDAALEGERACPCPDEEEVLKIDIPGLEQLLDKAEEEEEFPMGDASQLDRETELPLGEELEVDDDLLQNILEELEVDVEPQKSGWLESPTDAIADLEDEAEALENSDKKKMSDLEEANDELKEANRKLAQENEQAVEKHEEIVAENSKFRKAILQLKEKLEEVNVLNAKLLYSNRALNSDSLNERQKTNVVETIQRANSVEEAKVIYETLQSTVGGQKTTTSGAPESLSEVVNRNRSTTIPRRKVERQDSSASDRMKKLAGII